MSYRVRANGCWTWWRIGRVDAFRIPLQPPRRDPGQVLHLLRHGVNCCGWERFWKTHAVRIAIEMDKYNTIQWMSHRVLGVVVGGSGNGGICEGWGGWDSSGKCNCHLQWHALLRHEDIWSGSLLQDPRSWILQNHSHCGQLRDADTGKSLRLLFAWGKRTFI